MKIRDLSHAFRHPERESRCHELHDHDREALAERVEQLLATRLKESGLLARSHAVPTQPTRTAERLQVLRAEVTLCR